MASEAPPFWWEKPDWRAAALYPASLAYAAIATRRLTTAKREKVEAPVLCVGNFTVGGTGKTPVAIALARQVIEMKMQPGFLSRGHGGSFSHPHVVDLHHDSARHVGDEPLLLAEHGPVAVTPNRAAGAKLLIEQGCDFLIMDDGFQSARIHIDFALLVLDGARGIGNGHVIPGGPLRAPLVDQLRFTDAILKMGPGNGADAVVRMASRAGRPIFEASAHPRDPGAVAGRRYLAFAGIGNPAKFFDTVSDAGGTVVLTRAFPDHHVFTLDDFHDLTATADAGELHLITTAKDAVRLRHDSQAADAFLERVQVLEIDTVFELSHVPEQIIEDTLKEWRERRDKGLFG